MKRIFLASLLGFSSLTASAVTQEPFSKYLYNLPAPLALPLSGSETFPCVQSGVPSECTVSEVQLPQSSIASILGYPGGSTTAPESFTEIPSGVTLDVSDLTQTSNSDVIPINFLPGTQTSYPAGSHTVSGADNGTVIDNTATTASTFSLPPINAVAPYVFPSAFQTVMANTGTAVTTLAGVVNVSPALAAPTLNGAAGPLYLGPNGWSFTLTDGTGGSGNYVILEGGGYQFNSAGVAVWANALIASGFVPNSPACGLTGTGRIASYTGGGLAFCTNGAGAGSLDASGDLAITGYLSAQGFVSGTVLIPTASTLPVTAGINYPAAGELGFVANGIQAGYVGSAGALNWSYPGVFTSMQLTGMTTAGIVENNASGTLATSTSLPNGTTATTQSTGNTSTYVATDQFVANTLAAPGPIGGTTAAAGSFTTITGTGAAGTDLITAALMRLNYNAGTDATSIGGGSTTGTIVIGGGSNSNISLNPASGGLTITGVTTGTNTATLCINSSGTVAIDAANSCGVSSLRFKTDVAPLVAHVSDLLQGLEVATYRRIEDAAHPVADPNFATKQIGLIAENVASLFPDCAIYENDMHTVKSYRQSCIDAVLVKAAQESASSKTGMQWQIDGLMAGCAALGLLQFARRRRAA